eukprot:CAMPEP_0203876252 /NCGR_PEP_ID=MMETSP0359-20131031/21242_1 /ASSEMBLY_ACC=CAM_ASM_000338 /TAXON_ID=268821 /ORGANISM="Scrippsiella Hangoei, Strain SHTV-5" /LENGTH=448 /DNA_ID=CAMNT_0050795091 /DNA_START=37 /DNA_END=1383 /DNA_ORIENTATION=-
MGSESFGWSCLCPGMGASASRARSTSAKSGPLPSEQPASPIWSAGLPIGAPTASTCVVDVADQRSEGKVSVASPARPTYQRNVTTDLSNNSEMNRRASATTASFKRPSAWVLVFGWSLAVCAGFVNTVGYKCWGFYVSHTTGTTSAIGMGIQGLHTRNEIELLFNPLCLLLSFLLGAFTCGLLIDKNQVHFGGKSLYGIALVGNACLLIAAVAMGGDQGNISAASLAAIACGLQNAMCTSHFGACVRTTHVTGTITDIGSTLGRMTMILLRKKCDMSRLNVVEKAEIVVDTRKVIVLVPMWFSFVIGCIFGSYLHTQMHVYALLVPASLTFTVGLVYAFYRKDLKAYLKNISTERQRLSDGEKQRLSVDVQSMHATLVHATEQLNRLQEIQDIGGTLGSQIVIDLKEELAGMCGVIANVEENLQSLCQTEEEDLPDWAHHLGQKTDTW